MIDGMVLLRFVHFSLVLTLFGAWLFRPLLIKGNAPLLDRRMLRLGRCLTALALLSGVGWLWLISASMVGSTLLEVDAPTLQLVLDKTFFGQVWRSHLLLNALLLALLWTPWHSRHWPRLSLGALLLATLAPVGHGAMLDGLSGQLLILNQIVHLSCVAAWLGGLLILVLILRQPEGQDLGAILRRFSGIGYGLVAA